MDLRFETARFAFCDLGKLRPSEDDIPLAELHVPRGLHGPWPHWRLGKYGYIVLDAQRDSLGAHCSITCHGLCRANKVLSRTPLGYLVAWLQRPHDDPSMRTRANHTEIQRRLCSPAGYEARAAGRQWLREREQYADLLHLESCYRLDGKDDEPIRIRH